MDNSTNKTTSSKVIAGIALLITILSFVVSFFELPPATYLIKYYCQVFDTDRYPMILIGGILMLICLVPLLVLKKIVDYREKSKGNN